MTSPIQNNTIEAPQITREDNSKKKPGYIETAIRAALRAIFVVLGKFYSLLRSLLGMQPQIAEPLDEAALSGQEQPLSSSFRMQQEQGPLDGTKQTALQALREVPWGYVNAGYLLGLGIAWLNG